MKADRRVHDFLKRGIIHDQYKADVVARRFSKKTAITFDHLTKYIVHIGEFPLHWGRILANSHFQFWTSSSSLHRSEPSGPATALRIPQSAEHRRETVMGNLGCFRSESPPYAIRPKGQTSIMPLRSAEKRSLVDLAQVSAEKRAIDVDYDGLTNEYCP